MGQKTTNIKDKNRGLFGIFGIISIKYFHLNLHLKRFNYVSLSLFRPLKIFFNKKVRIYKGLCAKRS